MQRLDVIVIGAGITGIHQLFRVRELGMSVKALEAGSGVGGTWYWNRYPGARFDSESYSYGYFFSPELLRDWEWSEHFSGQPETERYLNHVVDRFDLRRDIVFDARVEAAEYDEARNEWEVRTADGRVWRSTYVITAVGILSVPQFPDVPGLEDFRGEHHHTGLWPNTLVEFAGKRVAVIGTGASGVQIVPEIARRARSLTVFQRTPNWNTPLHNAPITAEEQRNLSGGHDDLYRRCRETLGGFMHPLDPRLTFEVDADARREQYERLWAGRGLCKMLSNFCDVLTDPAANKEFSDFIAGKIRARVDDPVIARKLIPTDHGFGMKRPPLETGYYEAFNQDNVSLVDLREDPIVRFTESGLRTRSGSHDFDLIVFATGFDAVTGALTRLNPTGTGGRRLATYWASGPRTCLGVQTPGFPNLFFLGGPHGTWGNVPRFTEAHVDWVTGLLHHLSASRLDRVEVSEAAADAWTEHANQTVEPLLVAENSWFIGANTPGKASNYLLYGGGLPTWCERSGEIAAQGYPGFELSRSPRTDKFPASA